jgi:TPR repeat protein
MKGGAGANSRVPKESKSFWFFFFRKRTFFLLSLMYAGVAHADGFDAATLQSQAAGGDETAEFQLGTLDYVGLGVVQDYIGAMVLLKQSANQGNAEAACEVGFLYQTGSFGQGPPPPDPNDAVPWYAKSAAAGNACGEFALGALYQSGTGVAADPVKSAALLAQAAAQGFSLDPSTFPLEQLQRRFYAAAYKLTGEARWTDLVSRAAGGGQ